MSLIDSRLNDLFRYNSILINDAFKSVGEFQRQLAPILSDITRFQTPRFSLDIKPDLLIQMDTISSQLRSLYHQPFLINRVFDNAQLRLAMSMSDYIPQISKALDWSNYVNQRIGGLSNIFTMPGLDKVFRDLKSIKIDRLNFSQLYDLTEDEDFPSLEVSTTGVTAVSGQSLTLKEIQEVVNVALEHSGIYEGQKYLSEALNNLTNFIHKQNGVAKQILIALIASLIFFFLQPLIQPAQNWLNGLVNSKSIVRTVKQEIRSNPQYDLMKEVKGLRLVRKDLTVRKGKSDGSPALGIVKVGSPVIVIYKNREWALINFLKEDNQNITGWVRTHDTVRVYTMKQHIAKR